ncbi:PepSY-associated TM helix domain-containing protein [Gemmatimonadota bacterium]
MQEVMRKIHFYAGLGILTFTVMYFVTGYVMIHHSLIPQKDPVKTSRVEQLNRSGQEISAKAMSEFLQKKFDLQGKRQKPRPLEDGTWRFDYNRPGTNFQAIVSADGGEVRITETKWDARRILIGFHRVHGYGGGWLYDIWALMYDVASAALIVFPVTGVYLWYKTSKNHLTGWLFLAAGLSFTLATIFYLMFAP